MLRVIDGDTVDVDIDLGFGVWLRKQRIRLYGIDTPESRTSDAVEKIRISESKDSQSGIFTTAEELRSFNIVKTIIAMSSKVKNDQLDRISFRDYKGFFSVLVDNSQRKHICYFKLSSTKKIIIIGKDEHEIQSVSVKEITKFKKQLVDSAISELR